MFFKVRMVTPLWKPERGLNKKDLPNPEVRSFPRNAARFSVRMTGLVGVNGGRAWERTWTIYQAWGNLLSAATPCLQTRTMTCHPDDPAEVRGGRGRILPGDLEGLFNWNLQQAITIRTSNQLTRNVTGNSVSGRKQKRLRWALSSNPGEIIEPPERWTNEAKL